MSYHPTWELRDWRIFPGKGHGDYRWRSLMLVHDGFLPPGSYPPDDVITYIYPDKPAPRGWTPPPGTPDSDRYTAVSCSRCPTFNLILHSDVEDNIVNAMAISHMLSHRGISWLTDKD